MSMRYRKLYAFFASATIASASLPANAAVFNALCEGDQECRVEIGRDTIKVASLSIPVSSIISWGETESSSKRDPRLCILSITACALTIFHNYRYYVDYADEDGQQKRVAFRFVNDKPAKQLAREITGVTNLANGQRSDLALEKAEARRKDIELKKFVDSLDCSPVLKPYNCSYKAYLNANPAANAWAKANPGLVSTQMKQMKAVESLSMQN